MWFKSNHHQSVGNSISFSVRVLFNGEEDEVEGLDFECGVAAGEMCENLWFICVSRGLYYKSDPSGENHIEVNAFVVVLMGLPDVPESDAGGKEETIDT
ncbi:hypothetical protein CMV_026491 [Castanea mollissima]|uniref:Uncharacterized protein n=1 Tax=Castanea mollissima TaxID=60419 RepID=A0A8J4VFU5_9ROSI|nr:hypothetical protein CMV_026491 [Castanea mollissima]